MPLSKTARTWLALVAIALGVALIVVDTTIVNVIIPSIVRDIGVSSSQAQWVQESYAIAFAALLLVVGRVSDIAGCTQRIHLWCSGFRHYQPARRAGSDGRVADVCPILTGHRRSPDTADVTGVTERVVHRQGTRSSVRCVGIDHRRGDRTGPVPGWLVVRTCFVALGFRHQHSAGVGHLCRCVGIHPALTACRGAGGCRRRRGLHLWSRVAGVRIDRGPNLRLDPQHRVIRPGRPALGQRPIAGAGRVVAGCAGPGRVRGPSGQPEQKF